MRTKDQQRDYSRLWRARNPEKVAEANERKKQQRKHNPEKAAAQNERQKLWNKLHPEVLKRAKTKYFENPINVIKEQERQRNRRQQPEHKRYMHDNYKKRLAIPSNRIRFLVNRARNISKNTGRPFDEELLTVFTNPIPTHCACCGTALDFTMTSIRRNSRSPSFDRIDSTKGYTVKNVAVTCTRCNYAKSDATLAELRLFVAYVERETLARGL